MVSLWTIHTLLTVEKSYRSQVYFLENYENKVPPLGGKALFLKLRFFSKFASERPQSIYFYNIKRIYLNRFSAQAGIASLLSHPTKKIKFVLSEVKDESATSYVESRYAAKSYICLFSGCDWRFDVYVVVTRNEYNQTVDLSN